MSTITSVDRSYKEGTAYLFVPFRGSGDLFRDNICTRTTVYKPSLDRFRPPSAETAPGPTEGLPPDEDASAWVFAGVGVVAVALFLLMLLAVAGTAIADFFLAILLGAALVALTFRRRRVRLVRR